EIFLSGTNSKLSILLEGEIIRCVSMTVAIKFIEVEPDSLFHLQNIVRYNYPDTDRVEQEISNHLGNWEKW
ncbi:MAG: hypothetical protein KKA35_14535, partial [Proteobacteria bacterium]|nr:hypothetical protein [Pseudomonadota bacterium]